MSNIKGPKHLEDLGMHKSLADLSKIVNDFLASNK
mgnify:CR=1 FL=1